MELRSPPRGGSTSSPRGDSHRERAPVPSARAQATRPLAPLRRRRRVVRARRLAGRDGPRRLEPGRHARTAGHPLDAWGVSLAVVMALPLVARRLAPVPRPRGRRHRDRHALRTRLRLSAGRVRDRALHRGPLARPDAAAAPQRRPRGQRRGPARAVASSGAGSGPACSRAPSSGRPPGSSAIASGSATSGWRPRRSGHAGPSATPSASGASRAAEERTRIARDLHDSAGHAINVILVQAGAARLLHDSDPRARARRSRRSRRSRARRSPRSTSSSRALREAGGADGVEPPAGLAALDTLARAPPGRRARRRDVAVDGERRALPPGVDRAAYRILQEALTNAARHGAGRAAVEVAFGRGALELTVDNPLGGDAPGAAPATASSACASAPRSLGGTLETRARATAGSASTRGCPTVTAS